LPAVFWGASGVVTPVEAPLGATAMHPAATTGHHPSLPAVAHQRSTGSCGRGPSAGGQSHRQHRRSEQEAHRLAGASMDGTPRPGSYTDVPRIRCVSPGLSTAGARRCAPAGPWATARAMPAVGVVVDDVRKRGCCVFSVFNRRQPQSAPEPSLSLWLRAIAPFGAPLSPGRPMPL
jgi:hypothetical protein